MPKKPPPESTRWKKGGPSPNPSGKPKTVKEIEDAIRELGPRCVERLSELMDSESDEVAVRATIYIADRILGKAKQAVEVSGKDGGAIEIATARERLREKLERLAETTPAKE